MFNEVEVDACVEVEMEEEVVMETETVRLLLGIHAGWRGAGFFLGFTPWVEDADADDAKESAQNRAGMAELDVENVAGAMDDAEEGPLASVAPCWDDLPSTPPPPPAPLPFVADADDLPVFNEPPLLPLLEVVAGVVFACGLCLSSDLTPAAAILAQLVVRPPPLPGVPPADVDEGADVMVFLLATEVDGPTDALSSVPL